MKAWLSRSWKSRSITLSRTANSSRISLIGPIGEMNTHLQTAQPVLFSHHILAYVEMLARDRGIAIHPMTQYLEETQGRQEIAANLVAANNLNRRDFLYSMGAREKNLTFVRIASLWTVLGIVLNRLNVSLVAFNWNLPAADRYVPSFMEVGTTIFIVFLGITAYRVITAKMPILYEHPDYKEEH